MLLRCLNFRTAIFIEVGFFHALGGFIPFFHAHPEMPVQTGSPLGLKGSFVLRFASLDMEQTLKDTKF